MKETSKTGFAPRKARYEKPVVELGGMVSFEEKGKFRAPSSKEQGEILMEHGAIGRAFGEKDLGHDVRLASYGLDKNDNDFTIGLIGKDLHPLSLLVQTMRKTKQTFDLYRKDGRPFFGFGARLFIKYCWVLRTVKNERRSNIRSLSFRLLPIRTSKRR